MAKIVFEMPKGDADFDEMGVGEKKSVSCVIRKEEGGRACLVSVDGKTVPGYSDSDEEEEYEEGEEEAEEAGMEAALNEMMP